MATPESSNPYAPPQVVESAVHGRPFSSRAYFRGLMVATAASMAANYATAWWQWADQHDRSAYVWMFNSCIVLSSVMHDAAGFLLWFMFVLWPVSLAFWWWRKTR
jgi:hypothetical protein